MKTYYCGIRMSVQARRAVENAISTNGKYAKAYFWTPGCNAAMRRENEKRFFEENQDFSLKKGGDTIKVMFDYSESCKNVHYSLNITVNDEKKDIRALKNLLR